MSWDETEKDRRRRTDRYWRKRIARIPQEARRSKRPRSLRYFRRHPYARSA